MRTTTATMTTGIAGMMPKAMLMAGTGITITTTTT